MNKIKSLFKKSPIAMIVAGLAVAGLASAAVLLTYGTTTGTANVQQSVVFGGDGDKTTRAYEVGNSAPVAGNVYYDLETLVNNASDKSATVQLDTKYSRPGWTDWHNPEAGITTSYKHWADPTAILMGNRPTAVYNSTGDKRYEVWYEKDGGGRIDYKYYDGSSWNSASATDINGAYDCPFVMKENGVYYMVNYGSGSEKEFYIYTSDDGIDWTEKGKIYTDTNSNLTKVDNPKILKDNDGYKMYFQGKSTSTGKYYIFLATSDANSLKEIAAETKTFTAANSGNSVLQPGADGEWDSFIVMQPMVIKTGNQGYLMLYTGYATGEQAKIGYATSDDGIAWTKVKVSEEGYDTTLGTYALKTSVVKTDTNLVLFYQDNNDTNKINWTWLEDALNSSDQMTIQPKEIKPFFIKNDFEINLAPMNYTIQTNVVPK